VIRCKCSQNQKQEIPIVKCSRCKFWVHKACEDLAFGRLPRPFICPKCGRKEFAFLLVVATGNEKKVSMADGRRENILRSPVFDQMRRVLR
jgi:hypothetical protein